MLSVFLGILFSAGVAYARVSLKTGDEVVTSTDTEDNVVARLVLPSNALATSTVLVDISDNQNFRHAPSSGSVDISKIIIDHVAFASATTTIKIGVIASTSPAGNVADINWFAEQVFSTDNYRAGVINVSEQRVLDYSPSVLKTRVASASTTGFVANDISSSSTLFATTTLVTSPRGISKTLPNVGDVVVRVTDQKGTATTTVTAVYRVSE